LGRSQHLTEFRRVAGFEYRRCTPDNSLTKAAGAERKKAYGMPRVSLRAATAARGTRGPHVNWCLVRYFCLWRFLRIPFGINSHSMFAVYSPGYSGSKDADCCTPAKLLGCSFVSLERWPFAAIGAAFSTG
jgi:hypothetical protein